MSIANSTSSNPQMSLLPYQTNGSNDSIEPNIQINDESKLKSSDPLVSEEMFQIPKKKKGKKTFLLDFTPIFQSPLIIQSTSPKIHFTPPDNSEIERDSLSKRESPNKRESPIKSNRKISSGSSKEKLSPNEIGKIKKIQADNLSSKSFDASTISSEGSSNGQMFMESVSRSSSDAFSARSFEASPRPSLLFRKSSEINPQKYKQWGSDSREIISSPRITKDNVFTPRKSDHKRNTELLFIENKDELTFENMVTLEGKEAESFDKNFILEKCLYSHENLCTKDIILKKAKDLLEKSIDDHALRNIFLYGNDKNPTKQRAFDQVKIVQNSLLAESPIAGRLLQRYKNLEDNPKLKNGMTNFIKFFFKTLNELKSLMVPLNLDIIYLQSETKTSDNRFNKFLHCISQIKNGTYCPAGDFSNIKKLNKKMKPLILSLFGSSKNNIDEVLSVLEEWKDTAKKVEELKNLIHVSSVKKVFENIDQIKHFWVEPVDHSFGSTPPPIQKISPKDVRENYLRFKSPFTINEKEPFKGYKSDIDWEPDQLFVKLLSSLYVAFGYGQPDEKVLKKEIESFLTIENWDEGNFSEKTRLCFTLLQMGCINVAFRTDGYFKLRLGNKFSKSFDLVSHKNVLLNFCIKEKKIYAEHIREYKICENNSLNSLSTIQTSWKVPLAREDTWNCVLKLLNIHMEENINPEISKAIEIFLINLKNDILIENKWKKRERALVKKELGEIEIKLKEIEQELQKIEGESPKDGKELKKKLVLVKEKLAERKVTLQEQEIDCIKIEHHFIEQSKI